MTTTHTDNDILYFASDVIADARKHGGGTYLVADGYYTRQDHDFGYYVSRSGGVENFPDAVLDGSVLSRIVSVRHRNSGAYLGLWQDEAGDWSIDETDWEPYYNDAEYLGRVQYQRAIFDIANNVAINL